VSYTEIYSFNKKGTIQKCISIENAWRGCMAIWSILEKKYLPSLPLPFWYNTIHKDGDNYYSRTSTLKNDNMQEIWNLVKDTRLSNDEKICLFCTFDKVLFKKEDYNRVCTAFRNFEGETSLQEQAIAIEELCKEDIIAIGFSISLIENFWEEYNIIEGTQHYYLFDKLQIL